MINQDNIHTTTEQILDCIGDELRLIRLSLQEIVSILKTRVKQ